MVDIKQKKDYEEPCTFTVNIMVRHSILEGSNEPIGGKELNSDLLPPIFHNPLLEELDPFEGPGF